MTDLFDSIAAQVLNLAMTLRPHARSRFEPGPEIGRPDWAETDWAETDWAETDLPEPGSINGIVPSAVPPLTEPSTEQSFDQAAAPAGQPIRREHLTEPVTSAAADAPLPPGRPLVPPSVPTRAAAAETPPDQPQRLLKVADGLGPPVASGRSDPAITDARPDDAPSRPVDQPPAVKPTTRTSARRTLPALDPPPRHAADAKTELPPAAPADWPGPISMPMTDPTRVPAVVVQRAPAFNPAARTEPAEPHGTMPLPGSPVMAQLPLAEPPISQRPASLMTDPMRAPADRLTPRVSPGISLRPHNAAKSQSPVITAPPSQLPAPTIEITIGRLEIRAEAPLPSPPSKSFQPHVDLATYRNRRERRS